MKYAFIKTYRSEYPAAVMCEVFGVSRSGFYDYLKRQRRGPSVREEQEAALLSSIRAIYEESDKRYGSPRIHAALKKQQVVCSLSRVKKLMRRKGIYAVPKRKYKRRKTEATMEAVNLLTAGLEINRINQVWYSDITYIPTDEGWLYLAAVMDAYSKRIVGYAMAEHMRTDLVIQALRMATKERRPLRGLIHHSDKGSQYTSHAYGRELAVWGMQPSFTGTGACLDNAHIESFFATLKKELVYQRHFETREQARLAIFEYISAFYNRQRLHSSLGYESPTDFEVLTAERLAA